MAKDPITIYMLKPSQDGDSIDANRTIKVIAESPGIFVVLVTDRDYIHDPSGQTQTIAFRESHDSIDVATAEAQGWVASSLADGFIENPWSTGQVPPI